MSLNSLIALAALSAEPAFAQEQSSSLPVASNNTIVHVPTGGIKPEDIPCWQSHACTPAEAACERLEDFSADYDSRMRSIMKEVNKAALDWCLEKSGYIPLQPDTVLTPEMQAQNARSFHFCISDMRQPEPVKTGFAVLHEEENKLLITCQDEAVKELYKKSKTFH